MEFNIQFLDSLKSFFKQEFGTYTKVSLLPPAGSKRRYVRFIKEDGSKVLGVYNAHRSENNTNFYFSQIFERHDLNVPNILWTSEDKCYYFIEDLGEHSLFDKIIEEGYTAKVEEWMEESLKQLVHFQFKAGADIDYDMCYGAESFGQNQIYSDLLYFKYYFLDMLPVSYNTEDLLSELQDWSEDLASVRPMAFMYRDFQSRNIIINEDNELGFIDFQGGMQGFPGYDLASFLWQARARVPQRLKRKYLNFYYDYVKENAPGFSNLNEESFKRDFMKFVLLRILQTLGAYGYLGLIQKKPHFLESIAPALEQLQEYLDEYSTYPQFNELRTTLEKIVHPNIIAQFKKPTYPQEHVDKLKVNLFSFSYKKGLPQENSKHGGGFVFDCRGILNPGREEKYKQKTGKEKDVQAYLEGKTEMLQFLEYTKQAVDVNMNNYLKRGFDSLSIGFGCTGGQHRSVYAAEKMKEHLEKTYGVEVTLTHLEQEKHDYSRR